MFYSPAVQFVPETGGTWIWETTEQGVYRQIFCYHGTG